MSIFDEEITDGSLHDLGFVRTGGYTWINMFAVSLEANIEGYGNSRIMQYQVLKYNEKKKVLKYGNKSYNIDDLSDLRLQVECLTRPVKKNETNKFDLIKDLY